VPPLPPVAQEHSYTHVCTIPRMVLP
jgi:hypothetical protein